MTLVTSPTGEAAQPRAAWAATVDHPRLPVMPGAFRRAAGVVGNLLGVMGIILCVPFAILAILSPLALFLGFLVWLRGG